VNSTPAPRTRAAAEILEKREPHLFFKFTGASNRTSRQHRHDAENGKEEVEGKFIMPGLDRRSQALSHAPIKLAIIPQVEHETIEGRDRKQANAPLNRQPPPRTIRSRAYRRLLNTTPALRSYFSFPSQF
jgi:hypothetical protein